MEGFDQNFKQDLKNEFKGATDVAKQEAKRQILSIAFFFLLNPKTKEFLRKYLGIRNVNDLGYLKKLFTDKPPTFRKYTIRGKVYGNGNDQINQQIREIDNNPKLTESQKKQKKENLINKNSEDASFGNVKINAFFSIPNDFNVLRDSYRQANTLPVDDSTLTIEDRIDRVPDEINPLSGVGIDDFVPYPPFLYQSTTSNPVDGTFEIDIDIPVWGETALLNIQFGYTKPQYLPKFQPIITGRRKVKSDLTSVKLLYIPTAATTIIYEFQNKINDVWDRVKKLAMNPIDLSFYIRRLFLQDLTAQIRYKLIPKVIELLLQFGIVALSQGSLKVCPSPEQLRAITRTRNKIVREMNLAWKKISVNTALAALGLVISRYLQNLKIQIRTTPIATGFTTVPGQIVQNIIEKLDELQEKNQKLNKETLTSLVFAIAAIIIVTILLKFLDQLIRDCSKDNEVLLEEIDSDLIELAKEQEEDGNPKQNLVNGFELSVISIPNEIGNLKRRQAIAKNKDNVIMLKGDPSFSAIDQILIDELAFYIRSNNLKA